MLALIHNILAHHIASGKRYGNCSWPLGRGVPSPQTASGPPLGKLAAKHVCIPVLEKLRVGGMEHSKPVWANIARHCLHKSETCPQTDLDSVSYIVDFIGSQEVLLAWCFAVLLGPALGSEFEVKHALRLRGIRHLPCKQSRTPDIAALMWAPPVLRV